MASRVMDHMRNLLLLQLTVVTPRLPLQLEDTPSSSSNNNMDLLMASRHQQVSFCDRCRSIFTC